MSANNQTLIKEHRVKFYVFTDVMAESWLGKKNRINTLLIKNADGVFNIWCSI